MTDEQEVLLLAAEENYAHARDHEQLRAQVTATLVGASFVLVGLVLDKGVAGPRLIFAAVLIILIGVLNIAIVRMHKNRFDMHVGIARTARDKVAQVKISGGTEKVGHLWLGWSVAAGLPVVAGIGLLVLDQLCGSSLLPWCRSGT